MRPAPPPGLLVEVEHSAAVSSAPSSFGGGHQLTLQFADDQGASLFQRAIRTSFFAAGGAERQVAEQGERRDARHGLSRKT